MKRIVVTGGAGYIGSHVCVELLNAGCAVLIIDNFANASPEAVNRIREIAPGDLTLLTADLADPAMKETAINAVQAFKPDGAVHLAGLKAVGESVAEPARYYDTNIASALTLIAAMQAADAKTIVFSSSATVYGDRNKSPVAEDGATDPANPYGRTKLFIEMILKDLTVSDPAWRIANLRYFNPVGAHPTGRIGEDPTGVPNNLFPFIAQVAVGRRDTLRIFGDNYPTVDGTGVRDYIHVVDLAKGHLSAVNHLNDADGGAYDINLGVGEGVSVRQALEAFEAAAGRSIPHEIAPRRDGDVAEIYADAGYAARLLGWRAEKSLNEMCEDHWRWQKNNPNGYSD
ncbi:MAG: UDP-glucose 4-epimerase GalE [Pseudomonadota bacterium]